MKSSCFKKYFFAVRLVTVFLCSNFDLTFKKSIDYPMDFCISRRYGISKEPTKETLTLKKSLHTQIWAGRSEQALFFFEQEAESWHDSKWSTFATKMWWPLPDCSFYSTYYCTQSPSNKVMQWALFYKTESEIWAGLGSLEFMNFEYDFEFRLIKKAKLFLKTYCFVT